MAGKPRVTKQKQLIMAILKESAVPLTAGEIYERACRQQPTLAKSTVYRNLEALRERGEVSHGLLENGESLYEAVRPHEHALEEEIAGAAGFTVTDHVIQLYGYCKDCRKDGKGKDEL